MKKPNGLGRVSRFRAISQFVEFTNGKSFTASQATSWLRGNYRYLYFSHLSVARCLTAWRRKLGIERVYRVGARYAIWRVAI